MKTITDFSSFIPDARLATARVSWARTGAGIQEAKLISAFRVAQQLAVFVAILALVMSYANL
jgi:hypothetical protein